MSLTLTSPLKDSLATSAHYHCNCWALEREDGFTLAFTDHNSDITLGGYGYLFKTSGGWAQSARQRQTTLEDENLELVGVFESDSITDADLYAGRYNQCKILHFFVDWRVPEYGPISKSTYSISSVTFTGENWEAAIVGLTGQLKPKIGNIHSRNCSFLLGDSATCGVDLGALSFYGVRVATVIDAAGALDPLNRANFTAYNSDLPTTAEDWFNLGVLTWVTGNNAGVTSEVQNYIQSNRRFALQLSVPFVIQVGDTFDLSPGCDKRLTTCNTKFSNSLRFGGSPFMPTTDALASHAAQLADRE